LRFERGLLGEGQPLRGCEDFWMVTPGIALRHPGLFTGRPYGTSVLGEGRERRVGLG
jgi:hypothetical protein